MSVINHAIFTKHCNPKGEYIGGYRIPKDARCRTCSIKGLIPDCHRCGGVGRKQIPISEVLMSNWRTRRAPGWDY